MAISANEDAAIKACNKYS